MTETAATVRALTCPACGGTIALRAAGYTVSLVCEHCGTTLDAADPEVRVIAAASAAMTRPEIPLGTRGALDGEQWEVVGYLERSDGESGWSEYLLFNPYLGYAFLLDDGRRFSLGWLLDRLPESAVDGLQYASETYRRFGTPYKTWVRFVVGEFYWRVAVGEQVRVTDYVLPGKMLSCEENDEERTWTLLELLDRGVVERAFGIDKRGNAGAPAPHEPSPWHSRLIDAIIIGTVAALTLLFIAAIGSNTHQLAAADFTTTIDAPMTSQVIKGITLTNPAGTAVTIAARADGIDNGWVDVDLSLVNAVTDQSYGGYVLVEHYTGTDSDGAWSEGDRRNRATLSNVPPGRYDLVIELTGHRWVGPGQSPASAWGTADVQPVSIVLTTGGVFAGNMLLALLAILLWPAILWALHLRFEQRRTAPVT
ncbi:DUF4178 domain-containing protein [Sphingomonas glacialis]|uniref:DUF4178 domain-containing protein n=1 Tax=Sphingomonas glacialis TaxID=658225 RepID=A0A502FCI6_9SPHN|nr:DUF4178 domain-containing protein [Sphingomonas glacialis]TPG47100.1 DUF4178 domain-containing protein [Sphingomonas glacialis]